MWSSARALLTFFIRRPRICLRSSILRASSRASSACASFRSARKLLAPRTSLDSACADPVLVVWGFFLATSARASLRGSEGVRDVALLRFMDGTMWKQSVISTGTSTTQPRSAKHLESVGRGGRRSEVEVEG